MTRAKASVIPTVLTAVLAAALAGCGDESDSRDRSGPREPAAIGSSTAPGGLMAAPAAETQDVPPPAGMKNLRIALPKPAFIGTPKNIPPGTTVERPTGKPRPPLAVPEGVELLSKGAKVVLSDGEPIIGSAELVTDGDKEAGDGRYVELGPGAQYVQIDLGAARTIHAVVIWQYHGDPRVYRDVIVKTADDEDFITNVRTVFNNDRDNSSGEGVGADREYFETHEGKLVAVPGVKARFVRVYSNGGTAEGTNRFNEVEVYGVRAGP